MAREDIPISENIALLCREKRHPEYSYHVYHDERYTAEDDRYNRTYSISWNLFKFGLLTILVILLHRFLYEFYFDREERQLTNNIINEMLQECFPEVEPDVTPIPNYSPFNKSQMEVMKTNLKIFMKEGVKCRAEGRLLEPDSMGLAGYASILLTKLALYHGERVFPLHHRLPELFFPEAILQRNKGDMDEVVDPKSGLNWFREDVSLAEFHHLWHVIYSNTDPLVSDRQGEMFVYTHQQMVARYDIELLSMGKKPVEPWGPGSSFREPIPDPYRSYLKLTSSRDEGMTISDVNGGKKERNIYVSSVEEKTERVLGDVSRRTIKTRWNTTRTMNINELGLLTEAHIDSLNMGYYGNIHNDIHFILATINDPTGHIGIPLGPMGLPVSAPRDPLFYRLHKFLERIYEKHRRGITPYSIDELGMKGITISSFGTWSEKPNAVRRHRPLRKQLFTFFKKKTYRSYPGSLGERLVYKSELSYARFNFSATLTNNNPTAATVLLRVFLVPRFRDLPSTRALTIELEKKLLVVPPGTRQVEWPSEESSLVGRPGFCGWPPNLLIPKGSSTNNEFDLFVLATDWTDDRMEDGQVELESSYCAPSKIPDKRPLGYPFDRPGTWGTLQREDIKNSYITRIRIRHLD